MTFQIDKGETFFIGTVKEIPAINTQGKTVEEAAENIIDALILYFEDLKGHAEELINSKPIRVNQKRINREIVFA